MSGIGVVIPLYNHERFIRGTLASVLAQGPEVRRVIVIDDGSTDGSVAAARSVGDARIEVAPQDNAGAHAAINRGVSMLGDDCEFAAILNSDDCFLPGRLDRCVGHLASHPAHHVVATALEMIDDSGSRLAETVGRAVWYRAVRSLLSRDDLDMAARLGVANVAVTTSNIVARRKWLLGHPFHDYRYVHDYRCLLDAAFEGALAVLDEPLLEYRVHPANTINEGAERLVREMLRMHLELMADWAPKLAGDAALRRRFAGYQRMSWHNVSSLRQDAAHCLLASIAAESDAGALAERVASLRLEDFPELAEFPNTRLITADAQLLVGGAGTGLLATRLADEEKKSRDEGRRRRALKVACDRQRSALRSRWLALGRLLGLAPRLHAVNAPDSREGIDHMESVIARSPWLRAGAALGSRSCRALLAARKSLPTKPS